MKMISTRVLKRWIRLLVAGGKNVQRHWNRKVLICSGIFHIPVPESVNVLLGFTIYLWWRLLFLPILLLLLLLFFLTFFLPKRSLAAKTKPIQVWTPSWPKNTDPVSVTLTHFSRSQTHFCAKYPKIYITSFMIGFWWNLVGMDYYTTPCWWPTFRWPWPTSGQTRNRPEICCHRFGPNRQLQKYSSGATRWVLLGTSSDRTLVKID